MDEKKKEQWKQIIVNAVIVLIFAGMFQVYTGNLGKHNIEGVRSKIKKHLRKKYGEEFLVDRIGTRKSDDQVFYQARIYPKSIVGTNKEWDDYYYASASVNKLSFGRLGGVGDSYELVNLKLGIEDSLEPRVKKLFGKKILMKIEAHYKKREPGNKHFWGYKVESYEKAKKLIAKDPKNRMIELDLDLYVFNRIEDEEEKEKRRKDIFKFVQYLKQKRLFEFLELGVIFMDERVLAPSYDDLEHEIEDTYKVKKEIEGETVSLPPMKLRKKMSRQLQKEIDEMSEEELLGNIKKINKSELGIDGIGEYLEQYFIRICSIKMMKIQPYGEYEEEKEKGRLEEHKYSTKEDIRLGKENLKYIFRHQGGLGNE